MGVHIALFRAINVGGRNMVAMAALRDMFAAAGFPEARSLLQSGNIVFAGGTAKTSALEDLVEREIEKWFAFRADCFVRSAAEWNEALAHNPFVREAKADPGRLHIMALKGAPKPAQLSALRAAVKGRETVELWRRHAYIYYPDGSGNSKLTPRLIEGLLETRATGRNWNTAMKLQAVAAL
jgi:uncharacterized protein (DUF1697 family)